MWHKIINSLCLFCKPFYSLRRNHGLKMSTLLHYTVHYLISIHLCEELKSQKYSCPMVVHNNYSIPTFNRKRKMLRQKSLQRNNLPPEDVVNCMQCVLCTPELQWDGVSSGFYNYDKWGTLWPEKYHVKWISRIAFPVFVCEKSFEYFSGYT